MIIIIKNVNCGRFTRKSILPDTKNVTGSRLWNSRLTIEGGVDGLNQQWQKDLAIQSKML